MPLEPYRGVTVFNGASGLGGQALTDNFKFLVGWGPKSNWEATTAPTASDDIDDDYYRGSFWLRFDSGTSTTTLYLCTDNTASAAVWRVVQTWT